MRKGLFISIEGGDGVGKSTIISILKQHMEKKHSGKYIFTREPGANGSELCEQIREIILQNRNENFSPYSEALLYAASRSQHCLNVIKPNLTEGKIVISDRFIDSSLVYQGVGRGIGMREVYKMNKFNKDLIMPEKTILLMLEPEIAIERMKKNSDRVLDRLDNETIEFHHKVYNAYKYLSKKFKKRITIIDASDTIDVVSRKVISAIEKVLEKNEF